MAAEVVAEKKPKKISKKSKAAEEPAAQVAAEVAAEVVAEKKPKKISKKSKATEEPTVEPTEEPAAEVAAEVVAEKKPKKTSKKSKAVEEPAAEVVVPDAEAEQLAQSPNYANDAADFDAKSLTEEPYEQETEFEEVFVNEVLYYVDSNDNWLDAQQNPVSKPIN